MREYRELFHGHLPKNIIVKISRVEYLLPEPEFDMVKYFMSRLKYFHEPEASENRA